MNGRSAKPCYAGFASESTASEPAAGQNGRTITEMTIKTMRSVGSSFIIR